MDKRTNIAADVLRKAEAKFGFRFACELHTALKKGLPQGSSMLRQALAA